MRSRRDWHRDFIGVCSSSAATSLSSSSMSATVQIYFIIILLCLSIMTLNSLYKHEIAFDLSSLTKIRFLMHSAPSLSDIACGGHISCHRTLDGLPSPVDTPAHSDMLQALYRFPVPCFWITAWHECQLLVFLCCFLVLLSQALTLAEYCQHDMRS